MKRVYKISAVMALLVGSTSAISLAAGDPKRSDLMSDYANRRVIDTSTIASPLPGLVRLQLPLDAYRGVAHGDLRDIRIFNAKGEKVPFALTVEPDRTIAARATTALPIFPMTEAVDASSTTSIAGPTGSAQLTVKMQSDGTLISLNTAPGVTGAVAARRTIGYLVDASQVTAPITALQFVWEKNANSESGRITIEASADLANWRTVARNAPLIDLAFNGRQLSQKTVAIGSAFSPPADKYLRVTWEKQVFELTGVVAESIANAYTRDTQTMTVAGAAGQTAGDYTFDLAARLPVEQARLLLPEANTLAPTQLSIRSSRLERTSTGRMENVLGWQPVANVTFYRLNRDGVELVSPAVPINNGSVRGAREWQATVDGRGGGLGSGLPMLEVTWQPQQIIFAARGDAPFTLAFGRLDAERGDFGVNDLMPGYKPRAEFQLPLASLALAGDGAAVSPPVAKSADHPEWKKLALWAVLVVSVALLAWMAARLGRSVKSQSDE